MDDDALEGRLEQLGLSEKEIDTYLTILEHGEAKASTVAEEASVSTRYVYSASEALEDRGFVEVNDHVVPTTIRATPPEDVVSGLADELERIESALSDRYAGVSDHLQEFEVIKTRTTIRKRLMERLETAEREVALSVPASLFPDLEPKLRDAVDRGVLVLLIITDADELDRERLDGVATVVRTWSEHSPVIITTDQQYFLFAPHETFASTASEKHCIAIAQEQFVPLVVGSFFGSYWAIADEIYVADPAPLSRTFEDFRHAIVHATQHLEAGREVDVIAEARPNRSGDYRTIEGRLVDVRQNILEPRTNTFAFENVMLLDIDGERVTVGGAVGFVEDYGARRVTFAEAEE